MLAQTRKLERGGARIGFVEQQQVDYQIGLHRGEIARAIGQRAVGDFEQRSEVAAIVAAGRD